MRLPQLLPWRRVWLPLFIAILLTACATPGPRSRPGSTDNEAVAAYELGQYDMAAQLFVQMAWQQPGSANRWWLRAADSAWLAGDVAGARRHLTLVERDRIAPDQRQFANLLSLLTGEMEPVSAAVRLSMLGEANRWPEPYRATVHQLKAKALARSGQPYLGAIELIAYSQWLNDPYEKQSVHAEILRMISALSGGTALNLLANHQPDEPIYGWLALIADIKSSLLAGNINLGETIAGWRLRFPDHPAASDPLEQLVGIARDQTQLPGRIAVLLPFSGQFPAAARAVRDGLVSAFMSDPKRYAQLRFYDTGNTPSQALEQYRTALAEGAEQIIGPLDREAVTTIALEADGRVPVLALNHQDPQAPPPVDGVVQFGLLPEEEAENLARRMLEDGLLRVSVLAAADTWGERLSSSFVDRFIALGGVILEVQKFSPVSQDYGAVVSQIVGTTDAELRRRQLARALGFNVSFEAQPRHDLDAIFLAARPDAARLIKPQLAFYNGGSIPVYATSHVFNGRPGDATNRDLNGIVFCDAPFLLRGNEFTPTLQQASRDFAEVSGTGARLFAVGMDAYRMLPYLQLLGLMGTDLYAGATGRLSLDPQRRIRRSLDCARFANSAVVPLRSAAGL